VVEALDYKTGKVEWSHAYPALGGSGGLGGPGILSTRGRLLFTGDYSRNLIGYDDATGKILWHFTMVHSLANGPITFLLDGKQYLVVGAGDTLYAFARLQD
jgi:alcohol dehydrogenase (cytochrome c)